MKFNDEDICNEIINCNNPYDARALGGKYKSKRISNWSEVKYDLLEEVFRLKMEQNPIVRECLLNTLNYTILNIMNSKFKMLQLKELKLKINFDSHLSDIYLLKVAKHI